MSFLLLAIFCSFLSPAVLGQSVGTVRLYRNGVADTSQSWSSGIVQIYYSNSWGNICDDNSFGSDEADVICHQLGYTGASSYSNTGTTTIWGTDTSKTKMSGVYCLYSSYLTVTQCLFSTSFSSSCSADSNDVTVSCYSTRIWSSPTTGDIRLTGGTYSNQGLLEVYCNGQWGTVCDNEFHSTQAQVACRQLGYNYYDDYDHLSITGNHSQPIYLLSLSGCTSSDSCLTECGGCPSATGTMISSCNHSEDITLQCEYSLSYLKVINTTSSDTCIYYNTDEYSSSMPHFISVGNDTGPTTSASFLLVPAIVVGGGGCGCTFLCVLGMILKITAKKVVVTAVRSGIPKHTSHTINTHSIQRSAPQQGRGYGACNSPPTS